MIDVFIITEFITLGQFLKLKGIINNGSEAKLFLQNNSVLVNNQSENRRGRKLYPNDIIVVNNKEFIIKK